VSWRCRVAGVGRIRFLELRAKAKRAKKLEWKESRSRRAIREKDY
jgi:hypothetical protein